MTKAMLLLFVALLAVVATLVAPAVSAKEPRKGASSSITLPERQNEVPAFVAELDDKQARSTLVKVLEERTKPAEAEKLDFFAAAKRATSLHGLTSLLARVAKRGSRQPCSGAG
jgi:hypothetical protein